MLVTKLRAALAARSALEWEVIFGSDVPCAAARSIEDMFAHPQVLAEGMVASMQHPIVAAKNLGPMFHMAFSQRFYDEANAAIHQDPRFYTAVHDDGLKMRMLAELSSPHDDIT